MEFTKEGVEALLKEEHVKVDYVKRLKLCIKWFQQVEESLQSELEFAKMLCLKIELEKEKKIEELNAIIAELRSNNASLEEKLMKESSKNLKKTMHGLLQRCLGFAFSRA